MKHYQYRVFGLSVASDTILPDLPQLPDTIPPDVAIEFGPVPRPDGSEAEGLHIAAHGAILNIPAVGRYLIRNGDNIVVEPSPGASDRNIRLYLLGSAFGAILHQRGLLPLHANVIDFGGMAVAFMGHSGAGKSTLATWFHDHGRPILGDDVCVLTFDEEGKPIAEPGLPRVRLWGDALEASGRTASDYEASFDDMDKFDVPTLASESRGPLRLGAIYNLRAADREGSSAIERLTGVDAMHALVANTYRGAFVPMLEGTQRHLAQCVALSRQVPVFDLHRRWGLDVLAEEAAFIEEHVGAVLGHRPHA